MLALSRKVNESIMIGHDIEITVLEIKGEQVKRKTKIFIISTAQKDQAAVNENEPVQIQIEETQLPKMISVLQEKGKSE